MIVKLIMPDKTLKDFNIPDFVADKYERDIEVHILEGGYARYDIVLRWCYRADIKLVETY